MYSQKTQEIGSLRAAKSKIKAPEEGQEVLRRTEEDRRKEEKPKKLEEKLDGTSGKSAMGSRCETGIAATF